MTHQSFFVITRLLGLKNLHIRTVSGDLFSGDIIDDGLEHCIIACPISYAGYPPPENPGVTKHAVAFEHIESISESA